MARSPDIARELLERLESRGLSPSDPLAALDALASSWGSDPALEAAVVTLLGAGSAPEAGARLAVLADRTADKDVKREIKRALYKLAQRGLWQAPEAPPPPAARELLGPAEDEPEAWLSAIDPSGSRLLWMARRAGSAMASLSALVNESLGLQEFYAGETTRKSLRQAQRDLAQRSGVALVEAPWAHADALLTRAAASADAERAADVARARREIVPRPPAAPPRPPIDALLDRARVAQDEGALAASGGALVEKELGGWVLPRNWVEPALDTIDGAQESIVIVSPQQREERLQTALEQAAQEVFTAPERRELFAARFEETAYLLGRRGRLDLAAALLAASEAARADRPIAQIPILAQLAARSFGLMLEIRAEKQREEPPPSGLIMTPQQALAEQRRLASRRGR